MKERGATMILHSLLIGLVAYAIMVYVLGQSRSKAEDRSALLMGLALSYMILFGHSLPGKINSNLKM